MSLAADSHSAQKSPRDNSPLIAHGGLESPSYTEKRGSKAEKSSIFAEKVHFSRRTQTLIILGSVLASLPFFILSSGSKDAKAWQMSGMTLIMAVLWLTECIPLPVTSLFPIFFYPLFEIVSGDDICSSYFTDSSFVFIGSGLMALAIEKFDLHKRFALTIITLIGSSPHFVMLAFIIASMFVSMWIANTSTALIMMPMALAIIDRMSTICTSYDEMEAMRSFATGLVFAVTYATSIGGTATLTGTAPQLLFTGQLETLFPDSPEISFMLWSSFALPLALIFNGFLWLYLVRVFIWPHRKDIPKLEMDIVQQQLSNMGPLRFAEKEILAVFVLNVALWFFREPDFMPGWSWTDYITDSTIVVFSASILFLLPDAPNSEKSILGLAELKALPWDIYIILGGGFALSRGFEDSGLSEIIGEYLEGLESLPPFWILFFVTLSMAVLTEFTSNTAASALFLPIVGQMCIGIEIDPRFLMVPTTIAASYAFMFPVATGPNGVAYSTGLISVKSMAWTGLPLNILGVFMISAMMYSMGNAIYGIEVGELPDWAMKD